jgi:hypothetical protein
MLGMMATPASTHWGVDGMAAIIAPHRAVLATFFSFCDFEEGPLRTKELKLQFSKMATAKLRILKKWHLRPLNQP